MAVLMMVLLISACAAPSVYQPASNGGYGYHESQIADNRYRVSFNMRDDNTFDAMDYALLRASELALMAGYDWFVVVDRQVNGEKGEVDGAEISSGNRSASEVILEIRLGKGVRPTEVDSYDALEVRQNLRSQLVSSAPVAPVGALPSAGIPTTASLSTRAGPLTGPEA